MSNSSRRLNDHGPPFRLQTNVPVLVYSKYPSPFTTYALIVRDNPSYPSFEPRTASSCL